MKLSNFEDFEFDFAQGDHRYMQKGENYRHNFNYVNLNRDETSGNSKTRTYEKLLPVRKILQDSSIKVSMESVSGALEHKPYCVIPNRRVRSEKGDDAVDESNPSKTRASPVQNESSKEKLSTPKKALRTKILGDVGDDDVTSCKYKELMDCKQPLVQKKDTINIPMTELSGSPLTNFAQVRKLKDDTTLNIESQHYGIESFCMKQGSFCDQNIRFVDDDDDEFIE